MQSLALPGTACAHLAMHYQPIVSVRKKRIIGYEALARPRDAQGQPVAPDALFAEARREGYALLLDRTCQRLALSGFMQAASEGDSLLSVNMDTSHFNENSQSHTILALLEEYGLAPGRLMVEICEDAVRSQTQLENFVTICRELGVLVAIDDLGQKHSNLDRIINLRPDVLKLDRHLIREVHKDRARQNLVRSLAKMAVGSGSLVLAEGTECPEEILTLMELGVDLFQGYYFAKPTEQLASLGLLHPRLDVMGKAFGAIRGEGLRRHRQRLGELNQRGTRAAELLGLYTMEGACDQLDEVAALFSHCECVYVLDAWGEQLSCTRFPGGRPVHTRSVLFEPASRGADHSQRDYFYLLPPWDELQPAGSLGFLTEDYTSMATGNRCRTFSCWFRSAHGEPCILCVDLAENGRN